MYEVSKPTVYAVPACTIWLENIYIKTSTENDKAIRFASICKWPQDESKLSDYLERKKRPTDTWITYKTVKILKLCSTYRVLHIFILQVYQNFSKCFNFLFLFDSILISC